MLRSVDQAFSFGGECGHRLNVWSLSTGVVTSHPYPIDVMGASALLCQYNPRYVIFNRVEKAFSQSTKAMHKKELIFHHVPRVGLR
ncbi:unnamed protein product [Soboliphyme baturini]|uniref:WD_REPEATS_REGION domain-containing protein n=1 Tax=Soboliphyme baturini TaxID=241478 RepID=A0A183J006_9BILA|nr:unnamed protein product [Soboliphyme baturini]